MSGNTTIHRLDDATVRKIAAGEVVERPASVVKELVENSLDADADRIDVTVEDGGTDRIAVSDDGVGMHEADLRAAVREHTTSKIENAADLEAGVTTLGFRGEALHTIGAVSRMTLASKPREGNRGEDDTATESDASATELRMEGGEVEAVGPAGRPEGTTVEVTDLFYNTPARRKYLETTTTEFSHVNTVVTRYALANPDVAVSLTHDGREVFATTGRGDIRSALMSVYGREVAASMIRVEGESADGAVSVSGYVSDPETTRSTREYLSTYVNGRYVSSPVVREALLSAYGGQLSAERYPFAVLFVDVAPDEVDVNVHPRKMECRWSDEETVREAVETAVEDALLDHGLVRSSAPRGRSAPDEASVDPERGGTGENGGTGERGETGEGDGTNESDGAGGPTGTDASERTTERGGTDASDETNASDGTNASGGTNVSDGTDDRDAEGEQTELTAGADDGEREQSTLDATETAGTDANSPESRDADATAPGDASGGSAATDDASGGSAATDDASVESTAPDDASGSSPARPRTRPRASERESAAPRADDAGPPASERGTGPADADAGASDADSARKFTAATEPGTLTGGTADDPEFETLPRMRILGQLHDTYVAAETPEGLVLVDQHAADERVNYERLRAEFDDDATTQMLAEPVELELTAGEAAVFEEYREALERLGFRAERAETEGERTGSDDDRDDGTGEIGGTGETGDRAVDRRVVVRTAPTVLDETLDPQLLRDALGAFVSTDPDDRGDTVESVADDLLADLACYPSITGNTSLREGSVVELLAALDDCENPYACPHGRPVIIEFGEDEIEDRFERDYPGHAGRRDE